MNDASGVIRITTPRCKTDRFNAGSTHYLSPSTDVGSADSASEACPVAFFNRYFELYADDGDFAPLLRRRDGKLVTRGPIVKALKKHAARVGLDPRWIGSHSVRVGAATHLASKGVCIADIMLTGRWTSEQSCLQYLRMTRPRARRIGQALSLEEYWSNGSVASRRGISECPLFLRTRWKPRRSAA